MDWFGECGDALVDMGAMLDVGLRVGVSGSSQGDANVTGFSILEAESMEAAIAMVQSHPHLRYAEGCEIEVREYLTPPHVICCADCQGPLRETGSPGLTQDPG